MLHADSSIENFDNNTLDYATLMQGLLDSEGVSGGAFRFKVEHPSGCYRFKESCVAWRSKWLQMPYGDQGQFFTRSLYEEMGGLASHDIMEDVVLNNHMRQRGQLVILEEAVLGNYLLST